MSKKLFSVIAKIYYNQKETLAWDTISL